MAIALIAYFAIGGSFYNLLNGSNVATLAGTLSASMVGAMLGATAIFTSTRRDTATIIPGAAAGAFIGVVGGFLGTIDTARLEGIGSNVVLISLAVGAVVGAAGLRSMGGRFFGNLVDGDAESGTLWRILDGALAGIIIGVLCAVPVARFNSSFFIFLRKIDPAEKMTRDNRIEFVNVLSVDELLIGAILGMTVGLLLGFLLTEKRIGGLLHGMLVGALLGIIWALPEIVVNTTTRLEGFWGGQISLVAIAVATIVGAIVGAALPGSLSVTWRRLALLGGGTGLLFVLPYIVVIVTVLMDNNAVTTGSASGNLPTGFWDTFLAWNRETPIRLITHIITGASVCLIVGAFMWRYVGIALSGPVVAVILIAATLGLKGHYFLLLADLYLLGASIDLPSFVYGFSNELIAIPIRIGTNLSFGVVVGLILAVAIKLTADRLNPDRILPDQPTNQNH